MAASGAAVTKAGDTFVVHMDREALSDYPLGLYDVTVEIVTFEPGTEIAWTVRGPLDLGHVYRYPRAARAGARPGPSTSDGSGCDAGMEGRRHLPGHPGKRAAGHAGDPGPHRRPRQTPPRASRPVTPGGSVPRSGAAGTHPDVLWAGDERGGQPLGLAGLPQ